MPRTTVVTGKVVGYSERQYDAFGTTPAGITRSLWVSEDFGQDPVLLKIRTDEAAKMCAGLEFGVDVEATCDVGIFNNKESFRCTQLLYA